MLAAAWEREGLTSNSNHQQSAWYRSMKSGSANVDSVMVWLRRDSSVRGQNRSLEVYEAESWIRSTLFHASASGTLPSTRWLPPLSDYKKRDVTTLANITWRNLGPFTWDREATKQTQSEGIGVIRSIAVHPDADSIVLVGTISAGVWRSSDHGQTWKAVTDHLMAQQADCVCLAPSDKNIGYAALNVGLARTTDAGETWLMTSLDTRSSYPASEIVEHVAVSPVNPNHVIAATRGALWRSMDGGVHWDRIPGSEGRYWSIHFSPIGSRLYAIRYASDVSSFLVFDDNTLRSGIGLPVPDNGSSTPRALIATSPAAPSCVWVLYAGKRDSVGGVWGLYKSTDSGNTFQRVCCGEEGPQLPTADTPNLFDYDPQGLGLGQVTWDMAFAVSNTDTSHMVAGGIFPYFSTDGGRSWKGTAPIHYDVQNALIVNGRSWIATDGGLQLTTDNGRTFADRSEGICAVEVWGFGQVPGTNVMTIGAYHLPIFIRDDAVYDNRGFSGGWYPWSGADAMMADVNPDDTQWIYAKPWTSVRGKRSSNRLRSPTTRELGIDLGYLPFSNVAFHPEKTYTILAADHAGPSVVRTHNNAESWETLHTFTGSITHVRYAPSNPTIMAALADAALWLSDDDGKTWKNITPPDSLTFGARVIDVAFDWSNSAVLWLAFGGGQQNVKVLKTEDSGSSWTDVSHGLLSAPVYCLATVAGSEMLFAGTAMGVFSLDSGDAEWKVYGNDLPTCHVHYIHVDHIAGIVRAGTTRGIWEVPLDVQTKLIARFSQSTDTLRCYNTPIVFTDRTNGQFVADYWRRWTFEGGVPYTSTDIQPNVRYPNPGVYTVRLVVGRGSDRDSVVRSGTVVVLPSECDVTSSYPGNCVRLTDTNDFVSIGSFSGYSNTFTFTAWVKPHGIQPLFSAIFCTTVVGPQQGEIGLQISGDSNEVGYLWKNGRWQWRSGLHLIPDEWNHVAMAVDPDGVTLMVNGAAARDVLRLEAQDLGSLDFTLGTYYHWPGRNLHADVDEVRFYNATLSDREIRETMFHPADPDDVRLLAWYQCNETGGNELYDVARENTAELSGGAMRAISDICFGPGLSKLFQPPLSGDRIFGDLGISVQCQETDADSIVLVSRINTSPPANIAETTILSGRYYVVQTMIPEERTVTNLAFDTKGLIGWDDATRRVFRLWRKNLFRTNSNWELVRASHHFDVGTQVVVFRNTESVTTSSMFCVSVDGGPVTVGETSDAVMIAPLPANEHLRIRNLPTNSFIKLVDMVGRTVWQQPVLAKESIIQTSHLPDGLYILYVNSRAYTIPILH